MQARLLTASAVVAFSVGSAVAADLPSRKAAPVYEPPPPAFSWTGLYVGFDAGAAIGDSSFADQAPLNGAAFLGGATVGLNYQWTPHLVVGLETDANYRGPISGSQNFPLAVGGSSDGYLGTVRGRVGYSFVDRLLVFASGGLAYGNVIAPTWYSGFFIPGGFGVRTNYNDTLLPGWTIGGGLEYALTSNWSVKVEYLYARLADENPRYFVGTSLLPIGTSVADVPTRSAVHIVRGGVNYRFDWAPTAPVAAKY